MKIFKALALILVIAAVDSHAGDYAVATGKGSGNANSGENVTITNGKVVSGSSNSGNNGNSGSSSSSSSSGGSSSGGNSVIGKGPAIEVVKTLGKFSEINVDGAIEVSFTVSPNASIRIIAQGNIQPLIHAEVSNGELWIDVKGSFSTNKSIRAFVSGPSPNAIRLAGSGDFEATGLAGQDLRIRQSGTGDVKASGAVKSVNMLLSGTGDVNFENLKVQALDVRVSGTGDVRAFASASAEIHISGTSDVHIVGSPVKRHVVQSGTGEAVFE